MHKGLFFLLLIAIGLMLPSTILAQRLVRHSTSGSTTHPYLGSSYSSHSSSSSSKTHGSTTSRGYSRYDGYHSKALSDKATTSKVYHPGITHSTYSGYGNYGSSKTYDRTAAHKTAEKKKAEEEKAKAAAPQFKSANRLISPPTPKVRTPKPPSPFSSNK